MSKQARRRRHRPSPRGPASPAGAARSFTPVPVRQRHDGWTPARQAAFLQALGEGGCVEEAARLVGMSARSAYTLKARADAWPFRQAWEAALDYAIGRIGDALVGRALHGEVTPVFYRGEQIGQRRRHDNRLAMWLLRLRRPDRWGRLRERTAALAEPDEAAADMAAAIAEATEHATPNEAEAVEHAARDEAEAAAAPDPAAALPPAPASPIPATGDLGERDDQEEEEEEEEEPVTDDDIARLLALDWWRQSHCYPL